MKPTTAVATPSTVAAMPTMKLFRWSRGGLLSGVCGHPNQVPDGGQFIGLGRDEKSMDFDLGSAKLTCSSPAR